MDIRKLLLWLVAQIAVTVSAPIQMLIPHDQDSMQLQQQLLALQNIAEYQVHRQLFYPQMQPVIITPMNYYTNEQPNIYTNEMVYHDFQSINNYEQVDTNDNIDDNDAVVVDAEEPQLHTNINPYFRTGLPSNVKFRKFILLVPNDERFFVNAILTSLPFLPFEVNVPDTISWAWNGISSIISGIGQRWPFRPRPRPSIQAPVTGQETAGQASTAPAVKLLNRSPEAVFGSDIKSASDKVNDDKEIEEVPVPVFLIPVDSNYLSRYQE